MARGAATPAFVRKLVIKQFHDGNSMRKIGKSLNLAKSTVSDIIKTYGETASTEVRGKSTGRPCIVSPRQQRRLVRICKTYRRATLREITAIWNDASGLHLSRECCRKWMRTSGLRFYKVHINNIKIKYSLPIDFILQAKEKPLLTKKQKNKRLAWAKEKVHWSLEDWNKVIFSDESKFDVCVGDCRKRVIRSKAEAFHKDCLKRTVKFPKGQMIWGCMSAHGLGQLVLINGTINASKYQDILANSLLPSSAALYPEADFIFQQDGASSHTAKSTQKWFSDNGIKVLDWPSNSPDLNVIETLWHKMKQELRNSPQRTLPHLQGKLQSIWDSFTPDVCRSLVATMPARIAAVIKSKGDVTPY